MTWRETFNFKIITCQLEDLGEIKQTEAGMGAEVVGQKHLNTIKQCTMNHIQAMRERCGRQGLGPVLEMSLETKISEKKHSFKLLIQIKIKIYNQ